MENKAKIKTPDTRKFKSHGLGILFTAMIMASLLAACGGEIKSGGKVWITGDGANGTNPYSTNSAAPSDLKCQVPAVEYQIEDVDVQFDIIKVENCWLSASNRNVRTKAPSPTSTPFPTPSVFVTAAP